MMALARNQHMREGRLWRDTSFGIGAKIWHVSWLYVVLLCALAGVGYAALYSAAGGAAEPYASRHVLRFASGLVLMIGIALVDIRFIARLAWPSYFVALVLLVLVMRSGVVGKGAQRWIELGGLQLQPSELMKIALVLVLASWFHRASWERIGNPLFLIPPVIAVLVPVGLIVKEPNLGTAVITAAARRRHVLRRRRALVEVRVGGAAGAVRGAARLWPSARLPARADRHVPHPESDPLGAGYNIIQSKIALGSGGMWGKGFLQGTQGHLDFLPEKQTDFIFTMIGEEFGFVGAVALMALLGLIVLGGMAIALRCRHQFGRLVAFGIASNFFLYVFVNIAMVMGAIPVGGVPLPLVSHGGSAMIMVMVGFGLLMSVHVHRDVEFSEVRDAG